MGLRQGRLAAAEHAAAMPPGVRLCLHAANVSAHRSCLLKPQSARAQAPPQYQNAYPQAQQPQTYAPNANGNTNWERYGPGVKFTGCSRPVPRALACAPQPCTGCVQDSHEGGEVPQVLAPQHHSNIVSEASLCSVSADWEAASQLADGTMQFVFRGTTRRRADESELTSVDLHLQPTTTELVPAAAPGRRTRTRRRRRLATRHRDTEGSAAVKRGLREEKHK